MSERTCSIADCEKRARKRGWCSMHYERWRKHGDPLWEPDRQPETCTIDGCERPTRARGWCATHHARWAKHGNPQADIPVRDADQDRRCSVDTCDRPHHANGFCTMHVRRWQNHGNPLHSHIRPVEERFWEKVDAGGVCWEWTSQRIPEGYGTFHLTKGKVVGAHRLAWELLVGPIPAGLELDHLCFNPPCVNPDHLEPVTPAENKRRMRVPNRRR